MGRSGYRVRVDHIAIPVGDAPGSLEKSQSVFELMGFKPEWYRERIGNNETAMKTVVMVDGEAKFALMEGIDGRDSKGRKVISQVNEYFRRFGIMPQHIALRYETLELFESRIATFHQNGFRFITEDEFHRPRILRDENEDGTVFQCFTFPVEKSWFFELKHVDAQREAHLTQFEEFRDDNVQELWESVDKLIKSDLLFRVNIFGEIVKRAKSHTRKAGGDGHEEK